MLLLLLLSGFVLCFVNAESNSWTAWLGTAGFDVPANVNIGFENANHTKIKVDVQTTSKKFAFALYLKQDDMKYIRFVLTQDIFGDLYMDNNHWDGGKPLGVTWYSGAHWVQFDIHDGVADVYIDGKTDKVKTITLNGMTSVKTVVLKKEAGADSSWYSATYLKKIDVEQTIPEYSLHIYTEPKANIYIDNNLAGTTDNGGYAKVLVEKGEHQLKITKEDFWDYSTELQIENDTTLHIDLAPKTSLFRVEKNVTSDLYPNSIGEVKLTLYPIRTAYGTQMQISGVDVVKVYYKNSYLAESNGAYVLGTVDSPVDVEIQFKTPATWGEHSFAVTITATDIEGNQYTNQEQITYEVKELPFLLQTPSQWKIGDNTVTITDQSGEDYSVLLTLKDINGTEVWSQSQGFDAYDSHDFVVPINQSGDYVLEILAKGGQVKTYVPVHVVEPIKLLTPEVNASKGSVATIKIEIQNPTSEVKYYNAEVLGEIFDVNNTPKQAFSIAPGETKIVELKFKVPENITYDNYELTVEVFEKGEAEPIFQNDVILNIKESSFIPIGGDSSIPLWLIAIVGVLLVVGAVFVMRRK
ncbi:PEGA domain protein [Methanocaldococcus sp. FS406-22]|nr:PEGA domain protein [Methanocaldococcus sp. FS406-22]